MPASHDGRCGFTLEHYRDLLEAAKSGGYRFSGFDREPEPGLLFIRHDVDLSLEAAVRMAEVEAEARAWSTWCLMTRSVFYNLDSEQGESAIARLRGLGAQLTNTMGTKRPFVSPFVRKSEVGSPFYLFIIFFLKLCLH